MLNSFASWKSSHLSPAPSPVTRRSSTAPSRPVVRLEGDFAIQAQTVLAELRRVNADQLRLFQQGQRIVRRIHDTSNGHHRLEVVANPVLLAGELTCLLRFEKNGRPLNTLPKDLAGHLLGLEVECWQLPLLHSIKRVPFFDAQGKLVQTTGYHPEVGVWLDLGSLTLPEIPTHPTPAQLAQAKALINELLIDFPFSGAASRANVVSALLLRGVQLLVHGPVPLILNSASMPGSGKTALAQLPGVLYDGEIPAVMPEPPKDDEELTKRIVGVLQAGQELAIFDNVNRKLESSILAGLATSTTFSGRALYRQEPMRLPNKTQWVFTANNPVISKEFERRFLLVRLDAGVENPQNRTFRHPDLHQWAKNHRADLLWALLVSVNGWQAAGAKPGQVLEGGMRHFCETLGGMTEFLGYGPVFANRDELTEQAGGDDQELHELLECWHSAFATRAVTATELGDAWQKAGIQPAGLNGFSHLHVGRYMTTLRGVVLGRYRVNMERSGRNTKYRLSVV